MWHQKRRRRLGVTTPHRKAMLRNLVRGLAMYRRIETTLSRAKETSRLADKMVTIAKENTLSARRLLIRKLGSSIVAKIFIDEIAPRLQERNGGYTRVLKLGLRRGDGGQTALVEFSVPIEIGTKEGKPKKEKKTKPGKEVKETLEKKQAKPRPEKIKEKEEIKEAKKPEKKETRAEEEKQAKPVDKEETQKRGGFLSKLRKFLTGDEPK